MEVLTETERVRRQQYVNDVRLASQQGKSFEEYNAERDQLIDEWTSWLRAEMGKCKAEDPVMVMPQALAKLEMQVVSEARQAAETATKNAIRNVLRRMLP
jgi:hypothetical protein